MDDTNHTECVAAICAVLGIPQDTACHQVIAKVRETKAAADLAGAALLAKPRGCAACDLTGTRDHRIL